MNTYRVYLLNTNNVEQPAVEMAYFQATKYNDAWTGARATLAGKEEAKERNLYTDPGCTTIWTRPETGADDLTVVKILDCTPRNKKLDKATLADILADSSLTQKQKLEKIEALNK